MPRTLTISNRLLSIRGRMATSTWKIKGELGTFLIRRKLWAWRHRYKTIGGTFDGATLNSNLWDLKFVIGYRDAVLARAAGTLLTLRDRQTIEVLQAGDAAELFTVIAMVTLHLDHRDEKRKRQEAEKE